MKYQIVMHNAFDVLHLLEIKSVLYMKILKLNFVRIAVFIHFVTEHILSRSNTARTVPK